MAEAYGKGNDQDKTVTSLSATRQETIDVITNCAPVQELIQPFIGL